jgi:hypothetical protein
MTDQIAQVPVRGVWLADTSTTDIHHQMRRSRREPTAQLFHKYAGTWLQVFLSEPRASGSGLRNALTTQ